MGAQLDSTQLWTVTLIVDQLGRSGVVAAQWGLWGGGVGWVVNEAQWEKVGLSASHWGSLGVIEAERGFVWVSGDQ